MRILSAMEYRLLEKTELWISPIALEGADLGACARAVGGALGLEEQDILVTDALDDRLTLDILVPTVKAAQIVARQKAVLDALSQVQGVIISDETMVHSEGILGLISLDEETGREVLRRSLEIKDELVRRINRRALVIATGPEVARGQIRDTNTPYLLQSLAEAGYEAAQGPVVEDRQSSIVRAFRVAAEEAYGLIVTTGGVGAEGKDQTVEALLEVVPEASTPYVLKFSRGQGRHQKDGVRLGVGRWGQALIVCLPGPHDEVELLWPVLKEGLLSDRSPGELADSLANALRRRFLTHTSGNKDTGEDKSAEETHGFH